MQTTFAKTDRDRSLATSAHQLQRAAGAVQAHAGNRDAVRTHGIALAHTEEALDRLAVAMGQMASAVAEWCGEGSSIVDETALPPEARALRWHLRSVAESLRASENACTVSRKWTRLLLALPPPGDDSSSERETLPTPSRATGASQVARS